MLLIYAEETESLTVEDNLLSLSSLQLMQILMTTLCLLRWYDQKGRDARRNITNITYVSYSQVAQHLYTLGLLLDYQFATQR